MNKIYLILLAGIMSCLVLSCEKDLTYTGKDVVEFSPYNVEYANQQEFEDGYFTSDMDSETTDSIQVSLVGPQRNKDIVINFEIVDKFYLLINEAKIVLTLPEGITSNEYEEYTTTAVKDDNYTLLNNDLTTTIKKNNSFGHIGFKTKNTTGSNLYILIVLKKSSDIDVNENYKFYRLKIED
ncbi:MAG: hypothetical protein WC140_02820 [Bacteroidales bacterium]